MSYSALLNLPSDPAGAHFRIRTHLLARDDDDDNTEAMGSPVGIIESPRSGSALFPSRTFWTNRSELQRSTVTLISKDNVLS